MAVGVKEIKYHETEYIFTFLQEDVEILHDLMNSMSVSVLDRMEFDQEHYHQFLDWAKQVQQLTRDVLDG